MISLHRLFLPDLEDGTLEQLLLSPRSLTGIVLVRIVGALAHQLPAVGGRRAGFGAAVRAVGARDRRAAGVALLLGTPTLVLLGALGAALTLGLRGNVLLALIVLPLCVPVLIFGSGAVTATQQGLPASPHLSLLGACLLVTALLCPWAVGAALRLAVE